MLITTVYLGGCGSSGVRAPEESRSKPATASLTFPHYTVRQGDTLYAIALRHDLDYHQLAAWNRIYPPYTIHPGQIIRTNAPPEGSVPEIPPSTAAQDPSAPGPDIQQEPALTTAALREPQVTGSDGGRLQQDLRGASTPRQQTGKWIWPTEGKVITSFEQSGKKGVNIAGNMGQPVYATSDGKVVYSGNGLRGYGELIIIEHDQNFLSAYAHNNKMLVKEGDRVMGGQRIAEMGQSDADRVMLHFEIRRNGKPVDPMQYLSK